MNNLFDTTYGSQGSDCTGPYYITLKKECTVREFMNEWMKNKNEWGFITIKLRDGVKGYGRYHYGEITLPGIPDDVLDSKIEYVSRRGGWN